MPDFVFDLPDRFQSRVLHANQVRREHFDPRNKEHQRSLKTFLNTGNWGTVQFFAEHPYVTVPETVMRKFCLHHLDKAK